MPQLPVAPVESYIYEDDDVYVCLASYPMTRGHTVVVWKDKKEDLHLLSQEEYVRLMVVVEKARNALLAALHVKKVYLMYMDEANQVHWHLVPRYNIKGYDVLKHQPHLSTHFELRDLVRKNWPAEL